MSRPVPDGAIYVADWYNPIIGHYQASLRHPDRDKKHGRIWRVTAKGRDLLKKPSLANLGVPQLVQKLGSPIRYERERAREQLSAHPTEKVAGALKKWIAKNDDDLHLVEALSVYAWHEKVNAPLLEQVAKSKEPRARAFAARITGRWQDRISNAPALWKKQ